jgi:polyisoprenoid-binding protein YceI
MRKTAFLVLALFLTYSESFAATYNVDPAHTEIGFSAKHMVISNVKGVFKEFSGTVELDDKNILKTINAKISATSIDTRHEKRDTHLQSADFLDTAKFPEITFKSTSITSKGNNTYEVKGELTIRGVKKIVTLNGEMLGITKDPWGNMRAGFTAKGEINRKDFGLTWNQVLETGGLVVSDEVKLILEVEAIMQKG